MDRERFCNDIPSLRQMMVRDGREVPFTYLDSAATTLTCRATADAVSNYYLRRPVSIHRGMYQMSQQMTDDYEAVRGIIKRYFNAGDDYEVVFTKNATEALNVVAHGLIPAVVGEGSTIITTEIEHHANFVVWQQLAERHHLRFEVIGLVERMHAPLPLVGSIDGGVADAMGATSVAGVARVNNATAGATGAVGATAAIGATDAAGATAAVGGNARNGGTGGNGMGASVALNFAEGYQQRFAGMRGIVVHTGQSNVTGWRPELLQLVTAARQAGLLTVIDGAQLCSHTRVDVSALQCDFLTLSAHKMFGPSGVGVLIGKKELLQRMAPYNFGGNMISKVTTERTDFKQAPDRFEAGTPDIEGAVAFGETIKWLERFDYDEIERHVLSIVRYCEARLRELEVVTVYGNPDGVVRRCVVPFNVRGVHAHDVGAILDQEGVAIRSGHHCAQPFHRALGIDSTARASFHYYNTTDDVDRMIKGLHRVIKIFRPV